MRTKIQQQTQRIITGLGDWSRQNSVRKFGWAITRTFILTVVAVSAFSAYAAFIEPSAPPSSSTQDFAQNILGANNSHNAFSSSSVTANATGSIIERLQYIQGLSTLPAESNVKSGVAYGNQNNGSLTPASGASPSLTATAADVASGKLFFGSASSNWTPITGAATLYTHNEYNGSGSGTNDTPYTKALGGVDDYNNGSSMPATTYTSGAWTDCTGGSYCGADSNADHQDPSTGLIWSKWINSGNTIDWFWANNCAEPNQSYNGTVLDSGTCVNNGDAACQCVKLNGTNGTKTGCEALGDGNWRLPYQKELMQAYIDGSYGNLSSSSSNYWSSTTYSGNTQNAWFVGLYFGFTSNNTKTTNSSYRVRCVR